MPSEGYRARKPGSVRFDPYYKLEIWDARFLTWRPLQKQYGTEAQAQAAVPEGARARLTRISEHGREILRELPA